MARKKQTRGQCTYCGRELTRGGLSRHLQSCPDRLEKQAEVNRQKGRQQTLYHLQIEDAWSGDFWLHVEMRGNKTLNDLDDYLRAIWLECCGHLSAFYIGKTTYTQQFEDGFGWGENESMDYKIQDLLETGATLSYDYDFGSTTELAIKVVSQRRGKPTTKHPLVLMARNNLPPIGCIECERASTYFCLECMYESEDGRCELCDEHIVTHEAHDNYGPPMPLVNSPRTGICGYDGPATPPY